MFVKDSKDMGVQFNTSFVGNDIDGYTAGAHLVTSDGLDISNEIKGDNVEDAIQKLMAGLIKEALLTKVEDKKEEPKEDAKIKGNTKAKKVRELEEKLQSVCDEMDEVDDQVYKLENHYQTLRDRKISLNSEYKAIQDELHTLEDEDDEEESRPTLDDILDFDGDFLDYIDSLLK